MRITFTLIFLFVSIFSFSQMKVTELDKAEEISSFKQLGVKYIIMKDFDDQVMFAFKDENYKQLSEYKSFLFDKDDWDDMFDLFYGTNSKDGDSKRVELPSGDILIFDYKKYFKKVYSEVTHISKNGISGSIKSMRPNQVKKLFDKK